MLKMLSQLAADGLKVEVGIHHFMMHIVQNSSHDLLRPLLGVPLLQPICLICIMIQDGQC